MSDTTKKVLLMIVGIIVGLWALKLVVGFALALLFQVVVPVLVIGGIAYGLYYAFGRKALGGGSRKTLP
jgi:1,4-dihydroxy-2-naphthoate octaprenyltransferase